MNVDESAIALFYVHPCMVAYISVMVVGKCILIISYGVVMINTVSKAEFVAQAANA